MAGEYNFKPNSYNFKIIKKTLKTTFLNQKVLIGFLCSVL